MKTSSIWMAVLTLTAILLSVILLSGNERQARAGMINAQPAFIMMTVGANGADEGLIIIDKSRQMMVVYSLQKDDFKVVAVTKP